VSWIDDNLTHRPNIIALKGRQDQSTQNLLQNEYLMMVNCYFIIRVLPDMHNEII